MISIEQLFIGVALIILLSVFASKVSDKYDIPALLLFLLLGILAGSEGPGGIYFDNPSLAQGLGVTALAFILFSGGLDTKWADVGSVSGFALILSTLGVAVACLVVGLAATYLLGFSLLEGLLLARSYRRPTPRPYSQSFARATSAFLIALKIFWRSNRAATIQWRSFSQLRSSAY